MEPAIKITRETEFYQGYIRFKMAVTNESPFAVNEVTLDFVYDDELLRVDRYEPLYVEKKGKLHLGSIDGGKSKSIAVYFDPQMCSKGTDIECNVAYKDYKGKRYIVQMEPKEISVICPIFRTVSDINTGRLKEILERLPHSESCVFEVLSSFDMSKLVNLSREVIEKRNVKHVRTLYTKDKTNYELWYYGKTKVNDDDIVIKLSFLAVQHTVELFAATQTTEALTGLLAEVGKDLKVTIESRVTGKGRFNLHLINSKITGNTINNLLDQCNMDGTCDVNIVIDNINERTNSGMSNVNNTNFLNEQEEKRLEAEKQALLRIEKEKQERLQREKAEKELLRKREEERLRKQKEELGRIQAAEEAKIKLREEQAHLKIEQERLRKEKEKQEYSRWQEEERQKKQSKKSEVQQLATAVSTQKTITPTKSNSAWKSYVIVFIVVIVGIMIFGTLLGDKPVSPSTLSSSNVSKSTVTVGKTDAIASTYGNLETSANSIGMGFVSISAGTFEMGSTNGDSDEQPTHKVTIGDDYYLGKYEVTQAQWVAVMGTNPSFSAGDNYPVEQVSWNDVQEFVRKLNEMEGTNKYRLPSEAEWEYACRAGTTTEYSFGDDESQLSEYAWYSMGSGSSHVGNPVGQKKPNTWGLYDMHGNVAEWVMDEWHDDYQGAPTDGSAWEDSGTSTSSSRVIRGGSWRNTASECLSASKHDYAPDDSLTTVGFRLLKEV